MTIDEIKQYLCLWYPRHPDYDDKRAAFEPRDRCACENCHYGCDSLAVELLYRIYGIEELEPSDEEKRFSSELGTDPA